MYGYLGILLEGREKFEDECTTITKKNQPSEESGALGTNNDSLLVVFVFTSFLLW